MPTTDAARSLTRQAGPWFMLLALLIFGGEALGYIACKLVGMGPPGQAAGLAFAATGLVLAGAATVLLDRLVHADQRRLIQVATSAQAAALQSAELALAHRTEQQRRLRHDIRGVLSPVLLTADRLANHSDPAVQRSGAILVRTVERATALLTDPEAVAVEANPPAGP